MGGASTLSDAMRRWPVLLLLASASCRVTAPVSRRFDAPGHRVAAATKAALEDLGEVEVEDGVLTTYWHSDPSAVSEQSGFGQVLDAQSRYRVAIEGSSLFVEARSRLLVRRGVRRRNWEDVDPGPAAARLLDRIEARLR